MDLIAGVEQAIRKCGDLQPDRAERARAAVANVIRTAKPPRPNTIREELEALKTLRIHKEITILPAENGMQHFSSTLRTRRRR